MFAGIACALVLGMAALGLRLGARRYVTLALAFAAGSGCAAALLVWNGWAAAVGFVLAACVVGRTFAFGFGRVRWRHDRALGCLLGAAQPLLLLWMAQVPAPTPTSWVDATFANVHALRVLADLTPAEAQQVYETTEVRAVAEDDLLKPLWEDLALVAHAKQAAIGSRWSLLWLGRDLKVRAALEDEAFREKVRKVDLPAIAARIEKGREGAKERACDGASER